MTYVYVPYTSVEDLVTQFANFNIADYAVVPEETLPNFVLICPDLYYGSYGGLLESSLLNPDQCLSDALTESLSLVWWKDRFPPFTGFPLSAEDRVAVTPALWYRLTLHSMARRFAPSYSNAWRIHSASLAYSDSE